MENTPAIPERHGLARLPWWQILLLTGAILWILLVSGLAQGFSWILEQALYEGSFKPSDLRWLVTLVFSLLLIIPFGLLTFLVKRFPGRSIFRTFFVTALFVPLFLPARIIPLAEAQLTGVVQIIALTVFLIWLIIRYRTHYANRSQYTINWIGMQALPWAWIIFFGLSLPYLIWGALGSILDTALGLMVGILFGLDACLLILFYLLDRPEEGLRYSISDWLTDGLIISLVILIMVTGLGQNNSQWLLSIFMPPLGWAALALMRHGWEKSKKINFLPGAALLGLATSLPLVWLDVDELYLVTSSGNGDLLTWATRAVGIGFCVSLFSALATAILWKTIIKKVTPPWLGWGMVIATVVFGCGFHLLLGMPGLYGDHLFVILKDQADVSSATTMTNYQQRRQYVFETLVQHADETQSKLRQTLEGLNAEYHPYYLVNGVEVVGSPLLKAWLLTLPEVDRVLNNPYLRPLPAPLQVSEGHEKAPVKIGWNLLLIGADRVWKEFGVKGKGIIIGQSDSGVDGHHPEVSEQYRGKNGAGDYNWYDPWFHSTTPQDFNGHGTHTLGTILGKNVGIAPDATWIGCVNLARNLGNIAFYLDCMQFNFAPFPQDGDPFTDGKPALGAQVFNNSWGCPEVEGCDANTLLPAVKALKAGGVFVVVSAGNSGYSGCASVDTPPAIYQQVYSVGAVDAQRRLAEFSSRGPVTVDSSQRQKPDIVAPGEDVLSSFPNQSYEIASGTSMAGPHITGVVALIWSANPQLIGDIDGTIDILNRTATPIHPDLPECVKEKSIPNNGVGYGLVDAFAAVKAALE